MAAMEADYENVSGGYWNRLLAGAQLNVLALVRGQIQSVPQDAALSLIRGVFEFDPLPALQAYPGPKLVVTTPSGESPNALHQLVPDLPHKVMTGTSHWMQMDKPGEFNQIMDEFLATIK
jgi:pimeloyl-ACP methyl ester carboxylesterase